MSFMRTSKYFPRSFFKHSLSLSLRIEQWHSSSYTYAHREKDHLYAASRRAKIPNILRSACAQWEWTVSAGFFPLVIDFRSLSLSHFPEIDGWIMRARSRLEIICQVSVQFWGRAGCKSVFLRARHTIFFLASIQLLPYRANTHCVLHLKDREKWQKYARRGPHSAFYQGELKNEEFLWPACTTTTTLTGRRRRKKRHCRFCPQKRTLAVGLSQWQTLGLNLRKEWTVKRIKEPLSSLYADGSFNVCGS